MSATLGEAQRALARQLAQAGVDNAALDARLLVCAAAGLDHAGFIARERDAMDPQAAERLAGFAARRLAREPVSRILGRRAFWGMDFAITPAVLDPRPDTEILVETVLDRLGPRRGHGLRLLDLGTGSGAILAALLAECPQAFGVGLDRSEAAARVARGNLSHLGLSGRAAVLVGDWAGAIAGDFDVVVSNPPYIETGALAGLDAEVRAHDPVMALDGGADGLSPYAIIVRQARGRLKPGGILAVEIGNAQGPAVTAIFDAGGFSGIRTRRDLAGHDRVIEGCRA